MSGKIIQELKNRPFCLHSINWKIANVNCPFSPEIEWWQFRINKSRGRVIGMLIGKIFYVVYKVHFVRQKYFFNKIERDKRSSL